MHRRAFEGIEWFRAENLVGRHPLYLVGFEVPEHRGGPAVAALLTFADGTLLGARGTRVQPDRPLKTTFPFDIEFLDAEGLRRYTVDWNAGLGGFPAAVSGSISDYDAARQILIGDSSIADGLAHNIELDLSKNTRLNFPWDSSATATMTRAAVVCAVYGFTPSIDDVAPLDVSDEMKRSMLLQPTQRTAANSEQDTVSIGVGRLIEEASANMIVSPRATVALLRTAAEILVDQLTEVHAVDSPRTNTMFNRIAAIEQAWASDQPELSSPAKRRRDAWRSRVLASLDAIRDAGNAIHSDHEVTIADAERSIAIIADLFVTLQRNSPIEIDECW